MLDRAIGLLGLALALIFGLWSLAPEGWPKMPAWLTLTGIAAGILLTGIAIGMLVGEYREANSGGATANGASLFLQFSDQATIPKEISQTNVSSWYALYTESIYVKTLDKDQNQIGGFEVPPRWNVFLLFKTPASYRQMIATCIGGSSLKCSVQYSNDKYAIISAVGDVTRATLEVSTTQ
jgi:hypothetical protein